MNLPINIQGQNKAQSSFVIKHILTEFFHKSSWTIIEDATNNKSSSYVFVNNNSQLFKGPLTATVKQCNNQLVIMLQKSLDQNVLQNCEVNLYKQANLHNLNSKFNHSILISDQGKRIHIRSNSSLQTLAKMTKNQANTFIEKNIKMCMESIQNLMQHFELKQPQKKQSNRKNNNPVVLLEQLKIFKNLVVKDIGLREKSTIFKQKVKVLVENDLQALNPKLIKDQSSTKQDNDQLNNFLQIKERKKKQKKLKKNDQGKISDNRKQKHKIVRKIQFITKEKDRDWSAPSSGFGFISKLIAVYRVQNLSINQQTNLLISQQLQNQQYENETIEMYEPLIQKEVLKQQNISKEKGIIDSFKTQVVSLKYMRNYFSDYIAFYYLEQIKEFKPIQTIYCQFYPQILSENEYNFKNVLKIMKGLSQGLIFLDSISILHRDLKPNNVMISQEVIPKIIDFGSSWINNLKKNTEISSKLRTTRDYNITYQMLEMSDRNQIEYKEFVEHPYFDIYAFGKICCKILQNTKGKYANQTMLRCHISWLINRCTEDNPYNRISPRALNYYMRTIGQLFLMYNEVRA